MPLTGYMKNLDPGRISSITTLDGDKSRRKKIEVNERGGDSVYVNIYVRDCSTHKPRGAVVPVLLKSYDQYSGWVELGIARCCPLCWKVLVPPPDIELPRPLRQPEPKPISDKQRQALSKGRKKKSEGKSSHRSPLWQIIQNLVDGLNEFSVDEVMDLSGKSRTASRSVLKKMVAQGKIVIVNPGGSGIGDKTQYQAP